MKHYGDITKIDGHTVPIVDIIVGGSPCQDLSVAGKREGLAGQRSGLFMDQIRVIKEMHDECRRADVDIRPRYMVWENVPGAFSSNGGEDFRAVLEETAKVAERDACIPRLEKWPPSGSIMGDGWSIAWRVHDAQFWGVPQRRKRIALVADFRGESAPEILFEREGLSGDSSESGKARQEVAGNIGEGVETAGGVVCLEGNGSRPSHSGDGYKESETMYTLNGTEQHGVSYQIGMAWDESQISPTLTANNAGGGQRMPDKENFNCILAVGSFYPQMKAESQCWREDDKSNTIVNGTNPGYQNGVCIAIDRAAFNQGQNAQYDFSVQEDVAQTIVAKGPGGGNDECLQ